MKYTFHWRDGKRDVYKGKHPADALTQAGYGGGALAALDFHCPGDNKDYKWNVETKTWDRIEKVFSIS